LIATALFGCRLESRLSGLKDDDDPLLEERVQREPDPCPPAQPLAHRLLRWIGLANLLMLGVPALGWVVFEVGTIYLPSVGKPSPERWADVLPGLAVSWTAMVSIGLHFVGGVLVMVAGLHNIIPGTRRPKWLHVHRVVGRVFVVAALVTSVGGLVFIAAKRGQLVGGVSMGVAFAVYGLLLAGTTVRAFQTARAGAIEQHRRWASHAFGLALSSWVYRAQYSLLGLFGYRSAHPDASSCSSAGVCTDFQRPVDLVLVWSFFVPSLVLVELWHWGRSRHRHQLLLVMGVAVGLAQALVLFGFPSLFTASDRGAGRNGSVGPNHSSVF
jgi:uncharacterized membrane protein